MSTETLLQSVEAALARVSNGSSGTDIVSAGQIKNLEVQDDGHVRFSFILKPEDPSSLVKEARAAAQAVEGVSKVKLNVQLPQAGTAAPAGPAAPPKRGLVPGSVPAPTPKPGVLSEVSHVIAVSSGKGGVGKSMTTTNLAAALAAQGKRVGLLDADIYGPNIPLMFGEDRRPGVTGPKGKERIEPLDAHGVRLMSLGFLLEKEQPAIMRGPLISGILRQFIEQVSWGRLDYLLVDMPPGTGDAQLSLVQTIDLDGAIMVTTPQDVATGDVRRAIRMFERVNTRVLGIIENMAGHECPHCGESVDIFGRGGGEKLAHDMSLPFLGRIPLDPAVSTAGDEGTPTVLSDPNSAAATALVQVVEQLVLAVEPAASER
jgi:ATP-binding protein involved in chromosome partitioning